MFGPSRLLVLGPDSSLGPMIAATLLPIIGANGSPARAIALASMLALIVGAIMIAAGVAKLGFVADLLSKPTQIGYMNGLALTILIGQLPKLFGFSVDANGLLDEAHALHPRARVGKTVGAAVAVGLVSLALDPGAGALAAEGARRPGRGRASRSRRPSVFSLADHGVSLVGSLPKGFPPLTVPNPISDLPLLIAGALGIALVALTDTISTASAFAARTGQEVDGNGEMIGIGAANVAAGFFQGFPVSTSGSRTAVAEQAGAKTQLTGVVGAVLIVLMLVLVPGLLKNLPDPTLAAIVIAASLSLADIPGDRPALASAAGRVRALHRGVPRRGAARRARRGSRSRSRCRSSTCSGGPGGRTRRRSAGSTGMPGLHDRELHPEAQQLPGLVGVPLRRAAVLRQRADVPRSGPRLAAAEPRPRWIVIAAEPITDVDTTAADMLNDLDEELNAEGTSLVFAELKDPVRVKLERYELVGPLDPAHFFPTLDAAVEAFRDQTGAEWESCPGQSRRPVRQ